LIAAYGGPYFLAAVLKLAQDALAFLQPQLLRLLLLYISTYQRARNEGDATPKKFEGFAIALVMVSLSHLV
jgi:ATP-binding cassette subfamily C (CFTR/MRP) protein 1